MDSQLPRTQGHHYEKSDLSGIPVELSSGSEEAEGVTTVVQSTNELGISEEKPKPEQGNGAGLYTGNHNQFETEPVPSESSDSVSEGFNAANSRDTPEDVLDPASQSSTYTEKLKSAKNALASKIGPRREPGEGNKSGSVMGTAGDYANKIAATVTDTVAPVYGKVVGVGSGATSKVSGLGAETTQESGGSVGQDKGVSRKEYWVEKLKPSEEDKALSSMITEQPGEKMEEVPSSGGGERSDAVHKCESEESEERKPMGNEDKARITEKPNGKKMEELPNSGGGERGIWQKVSDAVHKRELEKNESRKPMVKEDKAMITEKPNGEKMEEVPSGGGGERSDAVHKREAEESEERKPMGKEDKALITEKPNGKKMEEVPSSGGGERGISHIVPDAVHKREAEESEERKPMGKVIESEEVAMRLGTGEESSGMEKCRERRGCGNWCHRFMVWWARWWSSE